MTTGNIFTLMINDGKQDALLNATAHLKKRITDIYINRIQQCMLDMTVYFENPENKSKPKFNKELAEWKADPIEFCLSKTRAVHTTLLEISKTHKIFIGACYKPFVSVAYSYLKINEKAGIQALGSDITFTIPQSGTWISDMVLHVKLSGLKAETASDKVKYCALLGHRLVEKVEFIVSKVVLAEYTSELYNQYFQFKVTADKRQGWLRNMGHEIPNLAFMTPDPRVDEYREYRWFGDGPQTLKYQQPDVDMYIPLLFWFNLNVAEAFPNIKVPKGNVQVRIKFADVSKIAACAAYPNSLGVYGSGKFTAPTITVADLYVNHINTLPEIQEILLQDYHFSLCRTHKTFEQIVQHSEQSILLKEIKFPVEYMTFAFRPMENYVDIDNWYRSVRLTRIDLIVPVAVYDNLGNKSLAINDASYYTETPVIDSCGLTMMGNEIFVKDTVTKFSSFYPYAAIGLNTPFDQGWLLFNNALYNNIYDPSGHIDFSRSRENYLNYTSSTINDNNRANLIGIAQTLNFLVIKGNSAYMKYI